MIKLLPTKSFKTLIAGSMLTLALAMPVQAMAESTNANTQAPLRSIAESIGAKVTWDEAKQQVTVNRGGLQFTVTIGNDHAIVNGKEVILNNKVTTVDGSTIIPLEIIEEALQVQLDWNAANGLTIDPTDTASLGSYYMQLVSNNKFTEARALMNDNLQQLIPDTMMPVLFNLAASPYGNVTDLLEVQVEKNKLHNIAHLTYMTEKSTPIQVDIRYDQSNKISDIRFTVATPPSTYHKPSYDNADNYTEEEVVVGEGLTAVAGTLTLPKGDGPFPTVILVHGSGPSDRDEAVGGYKTFRDLAVGLANKGIAVLRYDKQTFVNSLSAALIPKYTVKNESIDDVFQAVKLLHNDKRIDQKHVFVIGHSQGGMLVPQIIEQDQNKALAGAVVMAGPSKPLENVSIDQNNEAIDRLIKAGQPKEVIESAKQQVAQWEQIVSILHDPQYSTSNLPQLAIPGLYWWMDFRNYYAGELAKKQAAPLLILQGENDFQVNMSNYEGWKQALSTRKDVSFKSYPKLNHFFVSVDMPSTGAEYYTPGNVPATVIDDIAEWLLKQK
ncbi:alpha/beta fold hydrolase [Paenibacillus albiflavus]|uniref:Alpha/beta fold hydrolase n=1 Tax=Paenibacillus albiflavus TaxID=2545760 RepID=A0A4V2WNU7_9BACL|nr:alpha/beta fold hydrolase [Paenibacillus albiflavus]TCZ76792.1 alpha/beta fold hydrolase [Paenibacillus albiflavus]